MSRWSDGLSHRAQAEPENWCYDTGPNRGKKRRGISRSMLSIRKSQVRAIVVRWESGLLLIAIGISLPVYSYDWHLFLHITGAVVFLGNILVTFAWMGLAERMGGAEVLRFAARTVTRADLLFTGPGVILVLGNGLAMAADRWGGWTGFHEQSWLTSALILFALSGVVWVLLLLPFQFRMIRHSDHSDGDVLPDVFYSTVHHWYLWGGIAIALPIISLVLMVNKPKLW